MTKLYARVAVFILVVGLAIGIYLMRGSSGDDRFASCRGGAVSGGDIGGPFTLLDGSGATVSDTDVITGPTLIYFGYTFCPDVCPLDTVRNADAAAILAERGYELTPVFISVDPKRDTPETVADFASNIDGRMVGLTGSSDQVAAAAKAYRVFYNAHDEEEDEYYLVDHSTFSYLMLPEEGFVDFFRREASAEDLAGRIGCFLDAM